MPGACVEVEVGTLDALLSHTWMKRWIALPIAACVAL
jgi:hypothetical protein